MITCNSGRLIKYKKSSGNFYVIRLNLVETDTSTSAKKKYKTKDISTDLPATKANLSKANHMLQSEINRYSVPGARMPLCLYCDRWLEKKKPEIEIVSYEGYEYRLRKVKDYFGRTDITLGDLTPADVENFYHSLFEVEKTAPAQRQEKGLSNRTITDVARLFTQMLSDAVRLEYIPKNPAANVKIPKHPEEIIERGYVDDEDLQTFKSAIKGHRLEKVFTLTLLLGLRREEICGLRWIDIRDGQIFIEHTVTRMRHVVAKERTKSQASHRVYPLTDEIAIMLHDIQVEQQRNKARLDDQYQDSGYVFTWENGRSYLPDYVSKSFKKLVRSEDNDLDPTLTLHSLRASCVSILIHNGNDIKDVQKWVGHRDIQTTLNIYARTNKSRQQKIAEAMSQKVLK